MKSNRGSASTDVRPLGSFHPGPALDDGSLSRRRFLALAGGVAGGAILTACGGGAATDTPSPTIPLTRATAPPATGAASTALPATSAAGSAVANAGERMLVIEAVEYAFRTMGSNPAGVTMVQLKNLGMENHEAQFVRLNDGVTLDQFLAALRETSGQGEPPPIFTFEGGPAAISPGKSQTVLLALTPGQYVLLCLVPGPDNVPHAAKGMVLPLTVTAGGGTGDVLPAGAGTIMLGGGTLGLPETLPARPQTYRVANTAKTPHALMIGRLPADKTLDDVRAVLAAPEPPPWFESAGGLDGLKPGANAGVVLDLAPGRYAAIDAPLVHNEKATAIGFTVQ